MARKLLSVRDLKTSFFTHVGEVKAVRGISFDVNEGEVLGIVGESGSGKSVTSLSIMGLLQYPGRVVDGEILLNGEDILTYSKDQMRKVRGKEIAMIFQDPMTSLNPVYTIGNQVMEMILEHEKMTKREARARAIEMLKLVGIPAAEKRIDSYPHEFSGGMRQRVMIALALSCNPKLLIADEPTTALDVTIQAQILSLIKKLNRQFGMTTMPPETISFTASPRFAFVPASGICWMTIMFAASLGCVSISETTRPALLRISCASERGTPVTVGMFVS